MCLKGSMMPSSTDIRDLGSVQMSNGERQREFQNAQLTAVRFAVYICIEITTERYWRVRGFIEFWSFWEVKNLVRAGRIN